MLVFCTHSLMSIICLFVCLFVYGCIATWKLARIYFWTFLKIFVCPCRYQRLQLKCLCEPINRKYMEVLGKFSAEIDRIQKVNCNISLFIQIYDMFSLFSLACLSSTRSNARTLLLASTCLQ